MEFFYLCFVLLVARASAQSLMEVLGTNLELTELYHYVNASSTLTNMLSSLDNFTFLAPSNSAISNYLESHNLTTIGDEEMEELIQYHILNGEFPARSWSAAPQFVHSELKNPMYTNVTAGQAVELVSDSQGNPQILSWNKTVSTIVTQDVTCTGGVIQIISDVLTVPLEMGILLLQANFNFFVAGLYEVGITSVFSYDPVGSDVNASDVTFFIPNSADALNAFTDITSNMSSKGDVLDILRYHIVTNDLVYSTMFQDGMQLKTATGANITISEQNGNIFVNQAKIITPDFLVSNGVVHVIDGLLNDLFTTSPPSSNSSSSGTSNASSSGKSSSKSKIAIGVTLGIVLPLILAGVIFWFVRRRRRASGEDCQTLKSNRDSNGHSYSEYIPAGGGGGGTGDGGNKANRILGQDLELDPPTLSSQRYLKASAAELDSTPIRTPEPSESTIQGYSEKEG